MNWEGDPSFAGSWPPKHALYVCVCEGGTVYVWSHSDWFECENILMMKHIGIFHQVPLVLNLHMKDEYFTVINGLCKPQSFIRICTVNLLYTQCKESTFIFF